jgi:hypothetical protein
VNFKQEKSFTKLDKCLMIFMVKKFFRGKIKIKFKGKLKAKD